MTKHRHAGSPAEAWRIADGIIPTDYNKDETSSVRAGYSIYRSTLDPMTYIADLGARLEVNAGAETTIIWIDEPTEEPEQTAPEVVEVLGVPAEKIADRWYLIRLVNGRTIEVIEAPTTDTGARFAWQIAGQYWQDSDGAWDYLRRVIAERTTGVRVIAHPRREAPTICGANGIGCRCPGKCNTALCQGCPVAEEFEARRDGVRLVYAIAPQESR